MSRFSFYDVMNAALFEDYFLINAIYTFFNIELWDKILRLSS